MKAATELINMVLQLKNILPVVFIFSSTPRWHRDHLQEGGNGKMQHKCMKIKIISKLCYLCHPYINHIHFCCVLAFILC